MSGLFALLLADGQPVSETLVDALICTLEHRGGGGRGIWCRGAVGLGHQRRGPGRCGEIQPFVLDGHPIVVSADLRLDNRDELHEQLAIEPDSAGDAELVARAWLAWGKGCADRLLGDFAFALWDERQRVLFCARDFFGVKPLYYHRGPSGLFAAASEIRALVAHPEIPRRMNRVRVAEYLELLSYDEAATFYEGVFRLPPGHHLTVDERGMRLQRYTRLGDRKPMGLRTDEDWVEAFREAFSESVRARVVGVEMVGAFLSGGLDTSSIVCTARALQPGKRLHAFSAVFDEVPSCDERRYMAAVVDGGGVEHHLLHIDLASPLEDWERVSPHLEEPSYGASCYLNWGIYRMAREVGVNVLLDGWGGDGVVGYGMERLLELLLWGRVPSFLRELGAVARRWDRGRRWVLRKHVLGPLSTTLRNGPWRRAEMTGTTNRDLVRETGLRARVRAHADRCRRPPLSSAELARRELGSGWYSPGLEHLDRSSAPDAVDLRYPFYDRRVIEVCLELPSDQRLRDGWTRSIQRRAMAPVLPPVVRDRPLKTNLGPSYLRSLPLYESDRLREIASGRACPMLAEFVDLEALEQVRERFMTKARPAEAVELAKVIGLVFWLRDHWQPVPETA